MHKNDCKLGRNGAKIGSGINKTMRRIVGILNKNHREVAVKAVLKEEDLSIPINQGGTAEHMLQDIVRNIKSFCWELAQHHCCIHAMIFATAVSRT